MIATTVVLKTRWIPRTDGGTFEDLLPPHREIVPGTLSVTRLCEDDVAVLVAVSYAVIIHD